MKIIKKAITIFICFILLIVLISPNVVFKNKISANIYKKLALTTYSRNKSFIKYKKGNQYIFLLGTVHFMDLTSEPFSYLELKAVIKNLKPDLLLIESRPEQLAANNFADGPIEMLYSHLIAINYKIPVKGIDWWTENTSLPNSTTNIRDDHINKNIQKDIVNHKKILILLGKDHLNFQENKLKVTGYQKCKFSNNFKNRLFKSNSKILKYPKGMNFYLEKRINYEKNNLKNLNTSIWINNNKEIIKELTELSKHIKIIGEKSS